MTYPVLVAAPTYIGKDYALDPYLKAYDQFTFPDRSLLLVDNTRDQGEYAHHLRELNVPHVRRVEPSRDFEETFTRCWQQILAEADEGEYEWVLSLETDVIGPPHTIDALLNVAEYTGSPFVTHCYPYHDNRTTDMYQGLGCTLLTRQLLTEAIQAVLEPDQPWTGIPEGAIFEIGKRNNHVSLVNLLQLHHLDAPQGGSTNYWQYDEITDPRVIKV